MSRRQSSSAGVSLFPFLSILACLIGVLTMMIKIITDIKAQETTGRDEQEMNRAKQHQQLRVQIKKQQQEIEKIKAVLKERNAALVELSELENKRIVLRKKLADEKAKPKDSDKALQKLLEQLIDQIANLRKDKIKPDTKPQPVRINPAGSGLTANTQLLFIECNKNGLVILDKNGSKTNVSAATITTDGNLAAAFNRTKSAREHLVLFLIRADGSATFRTAGAHAETKFGLRIGKLPVPTQGEIDLSLFLRR
ncbi:MAG: hypothetical protein EAZ81_08780 [Verrucomicrobia bacterium]|nr:MAG: hypothetical protein EAZ81_08780 [Verrucomicrobiota bacterium]